MMGPMETKVTLMHIDAAMDIVKFELKLWEQDLSFRKLADVTAKELTNATLSNAP